jgi:hypothetical protein
MTTLTIPSFEVLTVRSNELEAKSKEVSRKIKQLNTHLGHIDGTFPCDAVRLNPERITLMKESAILFERIRQVNTLLTRHYKKELRQNRKFK